jgi:hypothetical protein
VLDMKIFQPRYLGSQSTIDICEMIRSRCRSRFVRCGSEFVEYTGIHNRMGAVLASCV